MIQEFVDRFIEKQPGLFVDAHPGSYADIVKTVIETVSGDDGWSVPDPERIHVIDDGDYQGTLVFVIAERGCQPSTYWYVRVYYGSCGGCDTLQSIRDMGSWDSDRPTAEQARDYQTLALHVVQSLKQMDER